MGWASQTLTPGSPTVFTSDYCLWTIRTGRDQAQRTLGPYTHRSFFSTRNRACLVPAHTLPMSHAGSALKR